jgi:3-dehydroquinate synthase
MSKALPNEIGRVMVTSGAGDYPVIVGPGTTSGLPSLLLSLAAPRRVAMITDSHVGPLYADALAATCRAESLDVEVFQFEAGEASKTRRTWATLTDQMLEAGMGRDTVVVSVGGGVSTDLAGFVAATFLRGVPVVQVPTSYLAMIDASVGGKTGVDVRAGKNLIGAFHPPLAVVIDTTLLETLPVAERAQGLVEALKHGAIRDESYFDALIGDLGALLAAEPIRAAEVVLSSVRIKAEIVGQDERESGVRQILNFGHTIGHAMEAASSYGLGHGAAVAMGMKGEAAVGEALGVTQAGTRRRLDDALAPLLNVAGEDPRWIASTLDVDSVMSFLCKDKKARAGRPRFVLLEQIGTVAAGKGWTHAIPSDLVQDSVLGATQ